MKLVLLPEEKLAQFKADMKYAFRKGAAEGLGMDEEVLLEIYLKFIRGRELPLKKVEFP